MLSSLQPGATLAGYRIEGIVARGGMGVVYRATQLALDRQVALKVIAPEVADDPSFRERFQRESRLAASIDHPNVIPVHEAGESDGLLYITMRLVDGVDLGRLVQREGPLPPRRAAHIIEQVAAALDAAHGRGLVHRDVKPANVLVASGDHVYLTDFGLVKNIESQSGVTQTGQVVGTVNYSAPEQIAARPVDARTDVYALGCVTYQVLTGELPFARDTPVATMWAHVGDAPPDMGVLRPELRFADEPLRRALAKSPDDRFPSAGDMARAMSTALSGERPVVAPERSVAVGEAAPSDPAGDGGGATQPLTAPTAAIAEPMTPATIAGPGGPDTPTAERTQPLFGSGGDGGGRPVWLIPVLAGLALITVATAALFLLSGGDEGEHDALAAETLSVRTTEVGSQPYSIAAGDLGVWVTDYQEGVVRELDGGSGKPKGDPVRVGKSPDGIAVGEGYVWVLSYSDNTLIRVDPGDHDVSGTPLEVGNGLADVEVGEGSVWVSDTGDDTVAEIDPKDNRIIRKVSVGHGIGGDIAVGEGYVWVVGEDFEPSLTRIDVKTGKVVVSTGVRGDDSVAAGEGFGWVFNSEDSTVIKVDPKTQQERGRQEFTSGSGLIKVGGGAVWALNTSGGNLWRIDPKTAEALDADTSVRTGSNSDLAIGSDAAWVTQPERSTVTRVGF